MIGYVAGRFGDYFFDDIRQWIGDNCDPDEVFGWNALKEWVQANADDLDVYTSEDVEEEIRKYIRDNNFVQEE